MKLLISINFCWLFLAMAAQADTVQIENQQLNTMAMEAKTAIQKDDNDYFLKYVAEEGIVFAGKIYSKAQINSLLDDKRSWLFKHLYSGKTSIKYFFETVQDLDVKVAEMGANAAKVTYASKNSNQTRTVQNCYIHIKDTWYLDGIFSCE